MELIMPRVIVPLSPNGFPMANTFWPTASVFEEQRSYLFSIAYRLLGSVSDAEDIVQDAFLRWDREPLPDLRSPRAYLTTIVVRLCLDQLRSARVNTYPS